MNTPTLLHAYLTLALNLVVAATALSQSAHTNTSIFPELAWAETYNREVDLMHSLLNETNKDFDQKVYNSVRTNANAPTVISYQLVSFVFYYPNGVAYVGSATEMAQPDELVSANGDALRRPTTNEIPVNCVRVSDPQRKNVGAEIDALLGVAPLNAPHEVKYFRRNFRFTYKNSWKEDKGSSAGK